MGSGGIGSDVGWGSMWTGACNGGRGSMTGAGGVCETRVQVTGAGGARDVTGTGGACGDARANLWKPWQMRGTGHGACGSCGICGALWKPWRMRGTIETGRDREGREGERGDRPGVVPLGGRGRGQCRVGATVRGEARTQQGWRHWEEGSKDRPGVAPRRPREALVPAPNMVGSSPPPPIRETDPCRLPAAAPVASRQYTACRLTHQVHRLQSVHRLTSDPPSTPPAARTPPAV